jgi:hypothetical protein
MEKINMKLSIKLSLFFIPFVLVAGCLPIANRNEPADETPTNESNSTLPLITPENITTPTTLPYGNFICPEIGLEKNSNIASGRLFYVDYDDYTLMSLDLQTMASTPLIPEGEKMESYALSPDAKWLVYKSVNVSSSKEQLIITNANKDEEDNTTSLPWENNWLKVAYWLNNEQVVIKVYDSYNNDSNDKYYYSRNLLLNPFSGEKQVLTDDFPNQYISSGLLDWNGAGYFIYNSTLTRVFYAETNSNLIMWDAVNRKELVRVPSVMLSTFHMQSPQWTLNGEKVLIAAPYNGEPNELFAVDQSGTVQKMTDLASLHTYAIRYGWSPDNRYIAMFIMLENERLAVLDTDTQKMDIYCIEGDTSLETTFDYRGTNNYGIDANVYKAVVWSPDSRQLIMENRTSANSSRIILVDVEKKKAYEILNNVNYQPVGWALP